jgi:hypothetical protein
MGWKKVAKISDSFLKNNQTTNVIILFPRTTLPENSCFADDVTARAVEVLASLVAEVVSGHSFRCLNTI